MAIQLSPGVQVVEKDFTQIIPSVATTRGAFAGKFSWGPINEPALITSENELVAKYRKPDETNFEDFFTAANFLAYSNNMLVQRMDSGVARNAVAIPSGPITSVEVTVAGAGYRAVPHVYFTDPAVADGIPAAARAVLTGGALELAGITISNPGVGYEVGDTIVFSQPEMKVTQNNIQIFDTATAVVASVDGNGAITAVTIVNAGGGYIANATATITSDNGQQAVISATPIASQIEKIVVTNGGSGYTADQTLEVFIEVLPDQQDPEEITTEAVATATVTVSGLKIRNSTHYTTSFPNGASGKGLWAAKYAGGLGNSLKVSMCDQANWLANATGTVYARKNLEDYEDERELVTVRITGTNLVTAVAELDAGKVLRTTTAGGQKRIGEIDHVDQTVAYRKVTLVADTTLALVVNSDVKIGAAAIGEIDAHYKYWDDVNDEFTLSKKVFYVRLDDEEVADIAVNDIIKNSADQTIGVVESVENVIVVYLTDVCDNEVYGESFSVEWKYKGLFGNNGPGTSAWAAARNGSNDEVHVVVIDEDGKISGKGAVLEKFADLSKASDARNSSGRNNYYKDVINSSSRWIWWLDHPYETVLTTGVNEANWGVSGEGTVFKSLTNALTYSLGGGVDSYSVSTGDYMNAYAMFADDEIYDISLLPVGSANPTAVNWIIQNVAEKRKDCIVFTTAPKLIGQSSSIASSIVAARNKLPSSSYAVMDSTWKYQYDKYNDKYRWIPMNGDTAGICARTDELADPWYSPGGFNRGQVKNIIKLAFNPNQAQRDELYKNGINPIVTFPGQGTILYGDKTLLNKASAFDRINVRRLFIVLEKAIATASKFQLFEFNDPFTRAQFRNIVEPFLRDVQGRRGIVDFRVRCDESNNTPEVIDSNQFVADIFIKPNRSINFITLNFIAAKTGVNFEELGL